MTIWFQLQIWQHNHIFLQNATNIVKQRTFFFVTFSTKVFLNSEFFQDLEHDISGVLYSFGIKRI